VTATGWCRRAGNVLAPGGIDKRALPAIQLDHRIGDRRIVTQRVSGRRRRTLRRCRRRSRCVSFCRAAPDVIVAGPAVDDVAAVALPMSVVVAAVPGGEGDLAPVGAPGSVRRLSALVCERALHLREACRGFTVVSCISSIHVHGCRRPAERASLDGGVEGKLDGDVARRL